MSAAGIVYRDLTDVPGTVHPVERLGLGNADTEVRASLAAGGSDSHALAVADHDEKGTAQLSGPGVVDLGWHDPPEAIPKPLVGGLPNDHLWMLIRRFNKVCLLTVDGLWCGANACLDSKCTVSRRRRNPYLVDLT